MKRTRIVKLFNILSKQEKTALKKYINLSDKEVNFKRLANYLLKHADLSEMLEEKQIIHAINPKLDKKQLGQLRFQMFQFVENFVLHHWLSHLPDTDAKHQAQKDLLLLDYYKDKELPGNHPHLNNLSKLIDLKQKQIQKLLGKRRGNNIYHYYYLYCLNYYQYYGLNTSMIAVGKSYIQTAIKHLDCFYALAKLELASEVKLRNIFANEQINIFGLDEMNQYLDNNGIKQPISKIYQLCNRLANDINEENLKLLKNELIKNEKNLHNRELSQLLTLVINYNTYISRFHNVDLSKTSYELLRLGLQRETFNVNGLIRPGFLINFAYLCTEFSDDKEIVILIKQYESRLSNDVKESTLNLCWAFIWWFQKDYHKAISATRKKPKRTFIFFLSQKIMQIKCFYELNQIDDSTDYINEMLKERSSLLKYLNNNEKAINPHNFKALIKFMKMLLKLINPDYTKKKLLHLMNIEYKQIFERRWLLRKIEAK